MDSYLTKTVGFLVGFVFILVSLSGSSLAQSDTLGATVLQLARDQKRQIEAVQERFNEVIKQQEDILDELKRSKKWMR